MTYAECIECGTEFDPPTASGSSTATCRECGNRQQIVRGPMVVITGCPGVGKSVVSAPLSRTLDRGVVLDFDLTGRREYSSDSQLMLQWFREWLRVGIAVAQASRFLVVSGFVRPRELEEQPERAWLSEIVYLALWCESKELERRLLARLKSRAIPDNELASLVGINEEVRKIADSNSRVSFLDTTHMSRQDAAAFATEVILERVGEK